jgi:trimeric autotransporter adhesin
MAGTTTGAGRDRGGMRRARRCRLRALATAAALSLVGMSAAAMTALADPGPPVATWVPNGPVYAVAIDGSTAYVGGHFSHVGPYTGGAVAVEVASGAQRTPWPDVSGSVHTVEPDGRGGWFLCGAFSAIGGIERSNLAHVLADGSVDGGWAPQVDGPVHALALSGDRLQVGGSFTVADALQRHGFAEIDAQSGRVTDAAFQVDGTVSTLATGGTAAAPITYIGGGFETVDGVARRNLAALDRATAKVAGWDAKLGTGAVHDIEVSGGRVYVGGEFTSVNDGAAARAGIASLDPQSAAATAWNPRLSSAASRVSVRDLAVIGSTVYAGGEFDRANDRLPTATTRSNAAAFDAGSGAVRAWNPSADRPVSTLEVAGDAVYLGGSFDRVNVNGTPGSGALRAKAAAVRADSGAVLAWDPRIGAMDQGVLGLAVADGEVVLGGTFQVVGGVAREGLAAIDLAGGKATAFDAHIRGEVRALAIGDGAIWAGGRFETQGDTRSGLANFDPQTGATRSSAQRLNNAVTALAVDGPTVYAGGGFTNVNGTVTRLRLAAFRDVPGTTGALLPFAPAVDPAQPDAGLGSAVRALHLAGGRLYVGGSFATVGTETRHRLAVVDAQSGAVGAWAPEPDARVNALTPAGPWLAVGGDFNGTGGSQLHRGAVLLDPTTGAPAPWDAGIDGDVEALATGRGQLFVGGTYFHAGGAERPGLAAFDIASGALAGWIPANRPAGIRALAASDRWVVVGGSQMVDRGPVRGVIDAARNRGTARDVRLRVLASR